MDVAVEVNAKVLTGLTPRNPGGGAVSVTTHFQCQANRIAGDKNEKSKLTVYHQPIKLSAECLQTDSPILGKGVFRNPGSPAYHWRTEAL